MSTQLLEIQPSELKFIFELKKQSSCSVRLINNSHNYVAFKVKTTSPKKYCVRPNVGIVMPKSTCDFTVTMQAPREAPPDMVCKDKFLIQSTIVPVETTDENITSSMFAKDDGRYIEENKLRVAFVSPLHSPALSPINKTLKQGPTYEVAMLKDPVLSRVEILTPPLMVVEDSKMVNVEELRPTKDTVNGKELKPAKDAVNDEELKPAKDAANDEELKAAKDAVYDEELKPAKDAELKTNKDVVDGEDLRPVNDLELKPTKDMVDAEELKLAKDTEFNPSKHMELDIIKAVEEPKLVKDIEEMKSKLNGLESKLSEAEATISKLTEERKLSFQERRILQEELAVLRSKTVVKQVQVGFPLLFVCVVALISVFLGYRLQP